MRFEPTPYFAVLSLTAIISMVVAFVAWQRRANSAASQPFILLMLAVAGYAEVAALESAAIALSDKIFWSTLEYVGSGSVITLFLIFALQFSHQKQRRSWQQPLWLWLIPLFNVVIVATNAVHDLVWTGFSPVAASNTVIYHHGWGFYWIMAWVYLYTFAGVFFLVKAALRPLILHRRQAILTLIGAVIPLIGGTVYMLDLTPPGLNITPMSFMLTGVIYFANLFCFKIFDLVPVARDALIENMSDGVMVLDQQHRIVDINPAARVLLQVTPASCIGQSVQRVLERWGPSITSCCIGQEAGEALLVDTTVPRYIDLQITLLRDHRHRLTGKLLVLRDITERYKTEVELRQANQRLQEQLGKIEALQIQLQEQAIRDGLTGVFNRRYFEETFERELARAAREGYPVAVLLLDIDFFKRINDTFGHRGGDRVLTAMGEMLRHSIRSSDIVCRYGGEEFVIVSPGMTAKLAYKRAEKIRVAFQNLAVKLGKQEIRTTLSGGIGAFPIDGTNSDDLLQATDQALYTAKANGRNQIQLVPRG